MSEDVYKMFSSQYSKKISLLSQQGVGYGKKKRSRTRKVTKKKKKRAGYFDIVLRYSPTL